MICETPILHHYGASPYAEKVRKVLAYKQLRWLSVEVPLSLPRPWLMALTGGYRKTPVLQLGCDVYGDTKLICRVLDRLCPQPPLVRAGLEAVTAIVERWVDQTLFFNTVALMFQPAGMDAFGAALASGEMDRFLKDRGAMFAGGGSLPLPRVETARAELPALLAALDAQLAAADFLAGRAPTQIDFAIYGPLWLVRSNAGIRGELDGYPRLLRWIDHLGSLAGGRADALEPDAALAHCRSAAGPRPPLDGAELRIPGVRVGDRVRVAPSDYAVDPVEGELVCARAQELILRRRDAQAGTVYVHLPPEAFSIAPLA